MQVDDAGATASTELGDLRVTVHEAMGEDTAATFHGERLTVVGARPPAPRDNRTVAVWLAPQRALERHLETASAFGIRALAEAGRTTVDLRPLRLATASSAVPAPEGTDPVPA